MIILALLILRTISWNFHSTLLNDSVTGFLINTVYSNDQLYVTVFGGLVKANQSYSNYLFVFNGSDFTLLSSHNNGPSKRALGCSAVVSDTIYYYGGYDGATYYNDLWSFSLQTFTWDQISVVVEDSGRAGCGMVNSSDSVMIFGGKKQNKDSTNLHYSINVVDLTTKTINFNSQYTILQNTLWDGTVENYTAEGVFPNYSSFIQPKNIWLSNVSLSQSQDSIAIVEANSTNSVIHILNSQDLLLKHTLYVAENIDSCQLLDVGLFCSIYPGAVSSNIRFIFFRADDWQKSQLAAQYIQYSKWPSGLDETVLFNISNDLMAAVVTETSLQLYRLPRNECLTNSNTLWCFYNKAYCADSYQGAYCDKKICAGSLIFNEPYIFENFTFECGGNGNCEDGQCICNSPYTGDSCSNYNRTQCRGEFQLIYPLSICTCTNETIGGNDCKTYFCYNDCSDIGTCNQGSCQCTLPYSGPDCSIIAIDIDFAAEHWVKIIWPGVLLFYLLL